MILRIITETAIVYRNPVKKVILPCVDGFYGVLPRHQKALFLLREGPLAVETEEGKRSVFLVGRGVARVSPDRTDALVEFFFTREDVRGGRCQIPALVKWYERVESEDSWWQKFERSGED